nr:BRO family protein [Corynebacterium glucuronolyticum]
MARHCKGVVNHYPLETAGGIQQVRFISEGDLYRLIVSSKLPVARQFESWVFDDILPSIRRHGMYAIDELLNDDEFLERAIAALRAERAKRLAAEQALLEAAPKVS